MGLCGLVGGTIYIKIIISSNLEMNRIIMHIDLDYFYAQLEELRNPQLAQKPLVVCMYSGRTLDSGAVASANYAARQLGVHAGMPIIYAKKKAPAAAFLPADRPHYEDVSGRIMALFAGFADRFEQESIDEASLDVSAKCAGSYVEAKKLAEKIKWKLHEDERLSCSVGVGPNKLIAKMAAGHRKPDGLVVVSSIEVKDFLRSKAIADLHGVGEKTAGALAQKGIKTIVQLAAAPVSELQESFGEKRGLLLHEHALGIDNDPVEEKAARQISRIVTLRENSSDPNAIAVHCSPLAADIARKAKDANVLFRTITILLVSDRIENITRSTTLPGPSQSEVDISDSCRGLLGEFFEKNSQFVCRRFGIRVSNFEEPKAQKRIFEY